MNAHDRAIFIALAGVQGVGSCTLRNITRFIDERDLSWKEFWHGSQTLWKEAKLRQNQREHLKTFQKKYLPQEYCESLTARKIQVILKQDPLYPKLLKSLPDAPEVLYVKGPPDFWNFLPIAVVGTRKPTGYGVITVRQITRQLLRQGATIVSGFMYGVDMTAHETALEERGRSIGVLGYGFDYLYSSPNEQKIRKFLQLGNTLVSQFRPDTAANKGTFCERNKVVAGMSHAVVVIEASHDSGSLITAGHAFTMKRPVCAVPGPITSQYSEGTRLLLNKKAVFIATGDDVIRCLPKGARTVATFEKSSIRTDQREAPHFAERVNQKILDELCLQQLTQDELKEITGLPIPELAAKLTLLELDGYVQRRGEFWTISE